MTYQTTVQQLVETFRHGLIAIIPTMDSAHIRWQGDTYDDWERIVEALFRSIVRESVESDAKTGATSLPEYDRLYQSYAALDYISVSSPSRGGELLAFHSLQSSREPFDTVRCARVSDDKSLIEMIQVAFQGSRFALFCRESQTFIESVDVEL